MTSKEDDTLPLPALSLEFSVDVTADEDFIPTSQPLGSGCSKVSKTSVTSSNKSAEEPNSSGAAPYCTIDDTLPREAVIDVTSVDKDKSSDFIPDTETKKIKISYAKDEPSCKKKLQVFGNDNICQAQSNPLWETQMPQILESPALDTPRFSVLNSSPAEVKHFHEETPSKCDKSIAEIIVNDSAETVDLEGSPMKVLKSEKEAKTAEKLSVSCSINSDVGRCEETQIFDNSSILLLEQQGPLIADKSEKSIKETTSTSQKLYLVQTVNDNESDLQEQENLIVPDCSPPTVAGTSSTFLIKEESADVAQSKENAIPKVNENNFVCFCVRDPPAEPSVTVEEQTSVTTRKIDFTLTVTCFVTFNTKTNKVLQKFISKVNETSKTQPKPAHFDHFSDNASDKSKRYSTSSSGSVYSDKHGLPFALSKRVSIVSDQTDSSEEDFSIRLKEKRKALGRTPWSNEYLLPLKLDELVQVSIESQQILERSSTVSSLREPKSRRKTGESRLKETVKSSSSEAKSLCNLGIGKSQSFGPRSSAENVKENPENVESVPPGVDKEKRDLDPIDNKNDSKKGIPRRDDKREKSTAESLVENSKSAQPGLEQSAPSREEVKQVEGQILGEKEGSSVVLGEGLPVLARWTDKRYYSGVLCGSPKNDRWDVKFDDGTSKTVREDLIMPTDWLKVGALVFALVDDKYVSGQIIDIKRGKEVIYAVELDVKKKKVNAVASDLCLTDVMVSIIREKYKPLGGTPRGKADIDFDNVLSGKRLREQRTPSRPLSAVQLASSEAKKKSSKKKDGCGLETIKETPETQSMGKRPSGLKSESGHLVEDKVVSADSPSGNEVGGTPLRRSSKETRGRAKPRALSYEAEETRSGRKKSKNWLMEDGTPIPGPSGVKYKRRKPRPKEDDSDEPPRKRVDQDKSISRGTRSARKSPSSSSVPEPAEKAERKRRLDGFAEENVHKKMLKKGDIRVKTKSRKG